MGNKDVSLSNLTDKQKTLLSQFSYIDVNINKYEKLKSIDKNITISDLENILSNPDEPYVGDAATAIDITVGKVSTEKELIHELKNEGLGDLKITDIVQDSKTGFTGYSFQDSNNNTGIAYRGTDLNTFIQDCMANAQEYIADTSSQAEQAKQFYYKNRSSNGNNYLYGHSLGGNLAEHVYLEDHENVASAFTINAYPINQDLLNTEDKINAFNNSEKFECNVIGGDWVSELRNTSKYSENINYIKNNDVLKDNIISDHLPEMATYNENGNFVTTKTKSEAYKGHEHSLQRLATKGLSLAGSTVKTLYSGFKKVLSIGGNIVKNVYSGLKNGFNEFKNSIQKTFSSIKNRLLPGKTKSLPESSTSNFKENLNLINWAKTHDDYTKFDAEQAIKVSDNPFKYITPKSHDETSIKTHNTEDIWPSHDHSHSHFNR